MHKRDLTDDPNSYRGISITSCFSKLFNSVLYFRILEVNDKVSLISNNRIGFLKRHRTADHVLLIDTIIHEIVHKHRKRLFVAIVDLKKAYDKVNRKLMVYELKRKGFSGKVLKPVKAVVNNIIQIPKINGRLLPPITTLLGVKQGDNLSPILFDIFFDDVEEIFDDSCNPIKLPNGLSINHLLYADDLAILSFSSEGLQNSLNRLYTFSNRWKTEVCTV